MIEYLRKFLIFIRKQGNREDLKPSFEYRLLLGAAIGFVLGVLLDTLLPFNFFFNMLRGVVANLVGFAIFSAIYIKISDMRRKKVNKDQYYKPIRNRLSYRQRVNFSIVIGAIVLVFIGLSTKQSPTYTFKASIAIIAIIGLLAFARPDRNEFIKDIYEIPDVRDLKFKSETEKKVERDLEKKEEEKTSENPDKITSEVEKKFNEASKDKQKENK